MLLSNILTVLVSQLDLPPAMDANKSSAAPRGMSVPLTTVDNTDTPGKGTNSSSSTASGPPPPVPTLTISDAPPATTPTESETPLPARPLTALDISVPPLGPGPITTSAHLHSTLSDPAFWEKIHALCRSEFEEERDADGTWKAFLDGVKGRLSAGEVARIIDAVGVTGESFRVMRGREGADVD
jgi:hypothetical protein